MSDPILFWHRRDLRTNDNLGLYQARKHSPKVISIFCLDPHILNSSDIAPARVKYLLGSLQALQHKYQQLGSQLYILQGNPESTILHLATTLQAKAVFWNNDIEPYAQQRDNSLKNALQQAGIQVKTYWSQLLHSPDEISTGTGTKYTVYTPFWKNWSQQPKPAPIPALDTLEPPNQTQQQILETQSRGLPTLEELGFTWDKPLILEPGETPAQQRLDQFCHQALLEYEAARNYPARNATSILSAALKFGTIGIRTVWQASQRATSISQAGVETWQKELAWREFYQHCLYNFPELAQGAYRPVFKNFPWQGTSAQFEAWCQGQTGYPIVDAAMRQMNQTGWMHNRCRMIVASFLTKDLIINWQQGEQYFMQTLVDGDLAANNGGWQWSASSGMDPKPLRIFNPMTQAQKFDPTAEYIRQWVPELAQFSTKDILTGKLTPLQRKTCGYPLPIVEHQQQQSRFKQLFKAQQSTVNSF